MRHDESKRDENGEKVENQDNGVMFKAAMAGLMGVAVMSVAGAAHAKKEKKMMAEVTRCYNVNKCKGFSKCAGAGHSCAGVGQSCGGRNACKGQGFLVMPRASCEALEGGSLTPTAASAGQN